MPTVQVSPQSVNLKAVPATVAAPAPTVPPATPAAAASTTVAAPPKRRGRPKKKTADPVPTVPAGVVSEPVAPEKSAVIPTTASEPTAISVVTPAPISQTGTIIMRDPKTLKDHPLRAVIPPSTIKAELAADMKERGFLPQFPIQINAKGEILDGDGRRDGAVHAGLTLVPCVVVELMDELDEADYIFRVTLLAKPLSEDQRAVVAEKWRKNRSKQLRTDRAQVANAAIAGDTLSSKTDDKVKQDSRKEAAELFVVPENKLKSIREIEKHFPARLDLIAHGEDTVSKALAAVKEKVQKKELKERETAAKKIPDTEDWKRGDLQVVLKEDPGNFKAALLYAADPEQVGAALKSLKGKMLPESHVLAFAANLTDLRGLSEILIAAGLNVRDVLFWDEMVTPVKDGIAGKVSFIQWATWGTPSLTRADGVSLSRILKAKPQSELEPPEDLLAELIEHATVAGERLVIPYNSGGRAVVAARLKGRKALAVVNSDEAYAAGKLLIDAAGASVAGDKEAA